VSRLSIVIPVLGNPHRMEDTLVSVLENRPAGCQIVVVMNEPYGDPYDLKREVDFVAAAAGSGWAACLNVGIAAARAPIVHVLGCGAEASPGWADLVLPIFDDPRVAAVAPLVLNRYAPEQVVVAGIAYRPSGRVVRLGRGRHCGGQEQPPRHFLGPDNLAGFFRKSALESIGGLDEATSEDLAPVELGLRLQQAGFRAALVPECIVYARPAAKCQPSSAVRKGRQAERLFWRWAASGGWPRSLVGHAALLAGECLRCLVRPVTAVELFGRLTGGLQAAVDGRRARRPCPAGGEPSPPTGVDAARSGVARPHYLQSADRPARSRSAR
jgi:GT2 family glycosyltransferase